MITVRFTRGGAISSRKNLQLFCDFPKFTHALHPRDSVLLMTALDELIGAGSRSGWRRADLYRILS